VSFGVHDELRVECFGTTQARMRLQARYKGTEIGEKQNKRDWARCFIRARLL
jgi:hypothetical protein